jgi:hypothetical protein
MMFDMKQARDGNTTSHWTKSIFRIFIGNKLFISDSHQSCFNYVGEAWRAFYDSWMWREISKYVDYSQYFFKKTGDNNWREWFENEIIKNMNVTIKEYVERDSE